MLLANLVPYEVVINAKDVTSQKPLTNILYFKDFVDHGGGYGAGIAASDDAVFAASVQVNWDTGPMAFLTNKYFLDSIRIRSITGWTYPTAIQTITGIATTLTDTHVITGTPHGLAVGNIASITGVTTPAGFNGSRVVTSVPTTHEFVVAGVFVGAYTGFGQVQQQKGSIRFSYGTLREDFYGTNGAIANETMPTVNAVSMRRLNSGAGRNWRSRISISDLPEGDQNNGRLIVASLANWVAVGATLATPLNGGGTCVMTPTAVSKALAFGVVSPFTGSNSWTNIVTSFAPRTVLGSMVRRKPKLTASLSPL